jgi:hypothetical protein
LACHSMMVQYFPPIGRHLIIIAFLALLLSLRLVSSSTTSGLQSEFQSYENGRRLDPKRELQQQVKSSRAGYEEMLREASQITLKE